MLYAIPSISAIAIKLVLLWRARRSLLITNHSFLAVFISLLALNISEMLLLTVNLDTAGATILVMAYYIFGLFSILSVLGITLSITKNIFPVKWLLGAGILVSALVATPGLIIEGSRSIGYSYTRIEGPYYFVIQLALLIPFSLAVGMLIFGALKSSSKQIRAKCTLLLGCLAPSFVALFLIVLLMQLGYQINATVIISFTVNILLFGLLYLEGKYHLYGLLSSLPGTKYNNSARIITKALFDPDMPLEKAKELMDIEKTRYTLELTNGNQSEAARILGVSRPTICRRIKLLESLTDAPPKRAS